MKMSTTQKVRAPARLRSFAASPARLARYAARLYRAHEGSYLLFCFLIPFVLMLIIYAVMGAWPFGPGSVLVLDLNGQYVYFFEALRDCIFGDSSLLYSFGRSLGGEFLGMYAYYLASPLSYLVALFPKGAILEAIFLMLLLKQGLSGLTFGYYLRKTTRVSPITTVIFSTVYSMTAYGVVMQHNTMWTDNVILLPLIAVGLRALVTEKKYKLYTLSLILAMMSNYYIGYMTCIFSVLYFFYLHLALTPREKNKEGRVLHSLLSSGLRFSLFSLLAGAVSMLTVIPALYSLSFGKSTFTSPTYEFVSKLDLFDILTKFFFASYDTVRPEGLPFVYCGIITLLLLPFYFISRRVTTREKGAALFLAFLLLFSFSIQVVDLLWHGGQAPNWLNYRYSYMLSFLLIGMAAKGFEDIRAQSPRWVLYTALPLSLLVILLGYLDYKHLESIFFPIELNLFCIGVYAIALSLYITKKEYKKRFASLLMLALVSLEMLFGGLLNIIQLDMDVGMSSRASYHTFRKRWEGAIAAAKEDAGTPFYRTEKLIYRKVNDPYMLDYRGVSGSTSTLNSDTLAFLRALGYSAEGHASCYTGANPFVDSFLSISYVAGEKSAVFPDSYEKIYDNGDVVTYKNPDALPIAFGVADTVNGITFHYYEVDSEGNRIDPDDDRTIHTETSPFERMNALSAALLGEDVTLFTPLDHRYSGENVYHLSFSQEYSPRDKTKEALVSFTVTPPEGSEVFAYFPTDRYTGAECFLNGKAIGRHFVRERSGYLSLGSYSEGEALRLSFKLEEEGIFIKRNVKYFYAMDQAVFDRLIATLSAGGYRVDTCREDYFSGTITVNEGFETILTTIPYDAGWQITVDGERITGEETLDALLSFRLSPGEHTLTLRYWPREYTAALCLFSGGTLILSAIILTEHLIKRKKERSASLADGKDLPSCSTISEDS